MVIMMASRQAERRDFMMEETQNQIIRDARTVVRFIMVVMAMAASMASTVLAASKIRDVASLPLYSDNLTGPYYRYESLEFLYTEMSILILGEVMVLVFLVPLFWKMLPHRNP